MEASHVILGALLTLGRQTKEILNTLANSNAKDLPLFGILSAKASSRNTDLSVLENSQFYIP